MADSAEPGPRPPGSAQPRQHRVRRRQPKRAVEPGRDTAPKQAPSPSSVHPKGIPSATPTSASSESTTTASDRSRGRSKSQPPPLELDGAHQSGGRDAERGIRALVGAGPTQIPKDVAMRVRDASRPTEEDLDEAERTTQVVRRNWQPRG